MTLNGGSDQFVMCASERFHQRFSSIDYGARGDIRVIEFRGIFSETLTAAACSDGCDR
jgi:hypothetical protein